MTFAQVERVTRGAALLDVIDILGDPEALWAHYPDGLTLHYRSHVSTGVETFVTRFDRQRSVVGVRTLTEDRWSQ